MPTPNQPTKEELNAQLEEIQKKIAAASTGPQPEAPVTASASRVIKDTTDLSTLPEPKLKKPEFGIFEGEEAKKAKEEMGSAVSWLRPKVSRKIEYGSTKSTRFEFKIGNYAEIYRGNGFLRFAPFVVKNDIESDSSWAQFTVDDFYGKKPSPWPWDWPSVKILWMPLDKSEQYAETMGTGGFKIKVDESSKAQLPLYITLNDEERQRVLKNNRMVSMALLLKSQLQAYEKPKPNWNFYLLLVILIIVAIVFYMAYQGGWLNGVIGWINHLSSGLSIPSQPQPGR